MKITPELQPEHEAYCVISKEADLASRYLERVYKLFDQPYTMERPAAYSGKQGGTAGVCLSSLKGREFLN